MDEVLLTNIFFIITSVAVVAFTILVCVAVFYVIKILASIRTIMTRLEEGSETFAQSVSDLHGSLKKSGSVIPNLIGMLFRTHSRRSSSARRAPTEDADSEE